jgi:hypothetical protein
MKEFFQFVIALGFANLAVSVFEFVAYRKATGALVLATVLFIIGFGGLFINDRLKDKN